MYVRKLSSFSGKCRNSSLRSWSNCYTFDLRILTNSCKCKGGAKINYSCIFSKFLIGSNCISNQVSTNFIWIENFQWKVTIYIRIDYNGLCIFKKLLEHLSKRSNQ